MGKHRHRRGRRPPRRRPRRRTGRRIALVSVGLLIPLTGGAAVFGATTHNDKPAERPATASDRRMRPAQTARSAFPSQAAAGPSASPTKVSASPTATPSTTAAPPHIGFTAYADVLSWPPLDLAKAVGGIKDFTMGFVAAEAGCSPAWGGLTPLTDSFTLGRLKDVPGKTIVSLGGPHGVELAQICASVESLSEQYRTVVDTTKPDGIDLFLTDAELADTAAVARRTQALTSLRHDHPDLDISFTLPLHRTGLSSAALNALRSAASGGLDVSIVNLIPADNSGQSLMQATTVAHDQLLGVYRQDDTQVWRRMGVTPIIGVAGTGVEFRPPDAQQLITWARARGLGRLSMWSITRDTPCTTDTTARNDTCSGLDEDAGAFTKIFEGF